MFSKNVKSSDIDRSLEMLQELLAPIHSSLLEVNGFPNKILNN
jgi:hypothetical protein